jgi:phosphoenolpyruvate carboxykinase (GTP)
MPILSDLHYQSHTPTVLRTTQQRKDSLSVSGVESPDCPILHGDWLALPNSVRRWVRAQVEMCQPKDVHLMDGSEAEDASLKKQLVESGVLIPLPKYDNCFLARTDPKDVARVESRTFISTPKRITTIPDCAEGVEGRLGNWISPADLDKEVDALFPGCMAGRTMYVIPFSMGPVGGPLSKNGIEISDSAYVAVSMRVMTRVSSAVLDCIKKDGGAYIKCLHTVGQPLAEGEESAMWPCNPAQVMIAHRPESNEIISFGSGYGGNSLLGKKCFALRIGSALAEKQGWLAEHMLIMGLKRPGSDGKRRYVVAAFPSACGKTNLAMLNPSLPGYDVTCVGDDIAWLRFDEQGDLRAINPENGFFGVAPGTSHDSNPVAMQTIFKNTVFTNVAATDDGGVWWEGMTSEKPEHLVDWTGKDWTPGCGRNAAHPNSRFCSPAENCPILDENWEDPKGVKVEAILFGGRRPQGVPLVSEALDWEHGVFLGAGLKSEATAAAEHKGKEVMHDPFSMRPFFGYNFGGYLKHWLNLGKAHAATVPKMFMVNWFRKSEKGGFLWPGFGDNVRVLDWVLRRCEGDESISVESPIGHLPTRESMNLEGIEADVEWDELFSTPRDFWMDEVAELRGYFAQQVGDSLPKEITEQLDALEDRISKS